MRKVYLAGPAVFRPDAAAIGAGLKQLCVAAGLEPLWPADSDTWCEPGAVASTLSRTSKAVTIFRGNKLMIRGCDAVIADVTPFRGPSLDPGTSWEIGFAHALGKPVFGYVDRRGTFGGIGVRPTELIDRIWCEESPTGWRDPHGDLVEDFGLFDNLMVALAVRPMLSLDAATAVTRCAGFLAGRNP